MDLYPYQEEGVRFLLAQQRAYLADVMGLGKSAQAVVAAKEAGGDVLIVCPASVVPHWRAEWRKWGPATGQRVRVVSYAWMVRNNPRVATGVLVADEAHYCKNVSAQRTRIVLRTARHAGRAFLLSGTPMPNAPHELWAPIRALWPEHRQGCTRKWEWIDKFCETHFDGFADKIVGAKNVGLLRETVGRFMLRRSLEDVGFQLPPLRMDLTRLEDGGRLQDAIDAHFADREVPSNVAGDLYLSTLRRVLGAAKAPAIAKVILEELREHAYDSIVVLYHHHDVGRNIRALFTSAGHAVVGFSGSSTAGQRQEAIRAFQAGEADIFLAQQTSAGTGIELTRSHEIVLVEPDWTPAINWQAIKRIHRIGQDKPCRARIFAMSGTLDEAIMATVARKTDTLVALGLDN